MEMKGVLLYPEPPTSPGPGACTAYTQAWRYLPLTLGEVWGS